MPKIIEIKVNYGRTVNMGNYESMRIDVEFAATVEPDEDIENATEELRRKAKLEVNRMIQNVKQSNYDHDEDFY